MSFFNRQVGHPPVSRSNGFSSNNGAPSNRPPSRPASRANLHAAFANAAVGTNDGGAGPSNFDEMPARPASPSKERMRLAGMRTDDIGGTYVRQKGDEESSIQVALRIRGLAPGDAPPVQPILTTSAPHCQSVAMAMSNGGESRHYPFDHVFSPLADQGMIYQAIVAPVLNEVISGYNCTIFAYGQTGTGKTHTMEGDLTPQSGMFKPQAGIIPRTLYRLFYELEKTGDEYTVHATFVELYNEELRDLLSSDAPQPLGHGSNSTGLRIYEEKGKGVMIQGVEDVPLRDAEHGIKLLQRGSQKRHVAATKCNESSSRSHCIFSLTVHIKETSAKGEAVLRTGKLNLVDLAGSENVGRSGAANQRAREAGMINQSLLTLGRVINALVEKSSHIPYRESKLTRLLQDSLGGKTKTCIIATVSPERANMDETLSTLEYALRAKCIRNRPEANQKMMHSARLKDYVDRIAQLSGDLIATREKNGIYFSAENWQATEDELKRLREEIVLANSKVITSDQRLELVEQKAAKAEATQVELEGKERELRELRELFATTKADNDRLTGMVDDLQTKHKESTAAAAGLHSKLERKNAVEDRNRDTLTECQDSLNLLSEQLEQRVGEFGTQHQQFTTVLSAQLRELRERESEKLRTFHQTLAEQAKSAQTRIEAISSEHHQAKFAMDELAHSIREEGKRMQNDCLARIDDLQVTCQTMTAEVKQAHEASVRAADEVKKEALEMSIGIVHSILDHVAAEKKILKKARTLEEKAMQQEVEQLAEQNDKLAQLLVEEEQRSAARLTTLSAAINGIRQNIAGTRHNLDAHARLQDRNLQNVLESNQGLREIFAEKELALMVRNRGEDGMPHDDVEFEQKLRGLTDHLFAAHRTDLAMADNAMQRVDGHVDTICTMAEESRQAEANNVRAIGNDAIQGFTKAALEVKSTLEDIEETCDDAVGAIEENTVQGQHFAKDTKLQLATLRTNAQSYLSSKMLVDTPTGRTPQKRSSEEGLTSVGDAQSRTKRARTVAMSELPLMPADVDPIVDYGPSDAGPSMPSRPPVSAHNKRGARAPSLPATDSSMPLQDQPVNRLSMAGPSAPQPRIKPTRSRLPFAPPRGEPSWLSNGRRRGP